MVTQQTISVGDNVRFTLGTTPVHGIVIDDRGPIGANRVRIFRIRVPYDHYDENVVEMPEDALALENRNDEPISQREIMNYLEQGGLVQILKSNMGGGNSRPRVWLGRDSLRNVVHTFIEERGSIGGSTVPHSALRRNRILAPKLQEVLKLLSTFGLSERDANQVVAAVGWAP